jgi:C4-dicarboxylate transporter, DctM subunit
MIITTLVVIVSLLILIVVGAPIYIALGFSSLLGFLITGGLANIGSIPIAMYGQIDNFILVAAPLYIFMGEILAHSGLGTSLYTALSKWLHRIPGGLSMASITACGIFGAVCGVSVAGVGAIAPVAVPEMIKRGYDRKLAAGSVTAAGALAVLIPPSIVMIVYGSITFVSVAKLFIGGIIPGIVLMIMMCAYISIRLKMNPKLVSVEVISTSWRDKFQATVQIAPVLGLIVIIFGALYSGIATPTEVGAVGVLGALILSKCVYKSLNMKSLYHAVTRSARAIVAINLIVACAICFGNFLNSIRVPEMFSAFCLSLPLGPFGIIIVFMIVCVVLGMFIDGISLILLTTPIFFPTVIALGFDPLWYGVLLALNIEMAVISPPVGMNLFMMKSVVPELSMNEIIAGAVPYMIVEWLCLMIFLFLPELTLWLPNLVG